MKDLEMIQELKNRPQWVCHNQAKIPLMPNGKPAKTNDPGTWSTFDQVWNAFQQDTKDIITGVGYVFSADDPFIGIDIDECVNSDGEVAPEALQIVNWCNSYTEWSLSGKGLHIIVKGTLPKQISHKLDMSQAGFKALEIYDSGRYFTMSGKPFGQSKPIRDVEVSDLPIPLQNQTSGNRLGHIPSKQLSSLIEKIKQGNDGQRFTRLHEFGDLSEYGGDQSRADMGYINIVSKWTDFEVELTDQLFRASALMRPKWDESHAGDGTTYGQMTIQKVLEKKRIYNKREHEGYLRFHYRFRYNVVLGRTEVLEKKSWHLLDDYRFNSIRRQMINDGAKLSVQDLHGILNSDFVASYNPFALYFENLPQWDGTDYIGELARQVETTNPSYWEYSFKKWLVAMVAGSLKESVVNHSVLILQGGQGIGKTTFLLRLVPYALKKYVYSGILNPAVKDTIINLSETLLINLDELETLTKYKEGALKEIITKSEIRIRRPYGRFNDKLPRRASLCGSVNDGAILQDPSGSRRFLIHSVQKINYKHNIDMDKVYSQALHLYKDGFKFWFDGADIQQIHAHNKQFENMSAEEELLLEHFEKADLNDGSYLKMSSTNILEYIYRDRLPTNAHSVKIRIGQALSKHGFTSVNRSGITHWILKRKKFSGIHHPTQRENVGGVWGTRGKSDVYGSHEDTRRRLFGQTHPTRVGSDVGSLDDGNSLEDSE